MTKHTEQYNPRVLEPKWQTFWEKEQTFKVDIDESTPPYYVLDMFPYPSGSGLHIGHPEGYTATDIVCRYQKALGKNVLHPMGWDAFGLPAEQHAINTGTPPAINTAKNIQTFKKQLKALGLAIDWDREINTTDPEYYKWTQSIFLELFKQGLAYVDDRPVWWCPALGTVLANEEVIDGKSERGDHPVEKRRLRQWVLRITAFADKLLEGLETLNWPESTKTQQREWIAKSEGTTVHFPLDNGSNQSIEAFTTRIDTLYGVSYVVLAPEHPLIETLTTFEEKPLVMAYQTASAAKSDIERTAASSKSKTGVFTGSYCLHPLTGKKLPIWTADYVLMDYGTGAVMAVPHHDERDFAFAQKYHLPLIPVLDPKVTEAKPNTLYIHEGPLINSGPFTGLHSHEAKIAITRALEEKGLGKHQTQYRLRDWLFSRQRYWGEPFPIVWVDEAAYKKVLQMEHSALKPYLPKNPVSYTPPRGTTQYALPIPLEQLPVTLPTVSSYEPTGTGESPLASALDWVNVAFNLQTGQTEAPPPGGGLGPMFVLATRETNTMPQWAGSCWYYLRYCDPKNKDEFASIQTLNYWKAPNLYIGGAEHATLHLLYARFWHKVLFEAGLVPTSEPFPKVVHQGLILGEPEYITFLDADDKYVSEELIDSNGYLKGTNNMLKVRKCALEELEKSGAYWVLKEHPAIRIRSRAYKMSKSRGNVISPDAIIAAYGADALRLYEMFLGPLEACKPWSTQGIEGVVRFLRKLWRLVVDDNTGALQANIITEGEEATELQKHLNDLVEKVSGDIEHLRLNTAISAMMIFLSHLQKAKTIHKQTLCAFLQIVAPFAPHIAEELWERLGHTTSIAKSPWPQIKAIQTRQEKNSVKLAVQINGKLRAELLAETQLTEQEAIALAKESPKVQGYLNNVEIRKVIYVPGRVLNMVVTPRKEGEHA